MVENIVGCCSMNFVCGQMTKEEEVAQVVHEFVNAVGTFKKLRQDQKKLFFQNVVLCKYLSDVLNDDHFHIPGIYLRSDKRE